jgi:hypothetical protein
MFREANNVFSVVLSDVTKLTANLPAVGTVVTNANLESGAVVLCDMGMRRLDATAYTALAATAQYFVVQGRGANTSLMRSPAITKGTTNFSIAKYKAPVQQVTYVGYNGTTGALPTANNSDFWIKVRKRDNDAANRSQPMSLFAGPVKTDATGNQAELATLLVKSGYKNFTSQEPANGYLKMEAVCNNAGASITGAPTSFGVTYRSKVVTITGTATSNVAVGDYIRLGGTTTTTPVYQVAAVTATTITLSSFYVGDTATILVASAQVIAAATAATATFGIKLTGVPAPFNVNTMRDYYANRFTTTFSDSSVLISVAGAQNGNGAWQQVAMDEYLSYGFEGENNQLAVPSLARDQYVKIPGVGSLVAADCTYSALSIAWTEDMRGLVSMAPAKGNVIVWLNLSSAGSLSATTNTGNQLVTSFGLTASDFNA